MQISHVRYAQSYEKYQYIKSKHKKQIRKSNQCIFKNPKIVSLNPFKTWLLVECLQFSSKCSVIYYTINFCEKLSLYKIGLATGLAPYLMQNTVITNRQATTANCLQQARAEKLHQMLCLSCSCQYTCLKLQLFTLDQCLANINDLYPTLLKFSI